jgi:uncharacterized protein YuzE
LQRLVAHVSWQPAVQAPSQVGSSASQAAWQAGTSGTPGTVHLARQSKCVFSKVEYDSVSDTLTVTLRQGEVAESDEDKPGVILDYEEAGNLLSIELLDASQRVEEPRSVTFSVKG